MQAAVRRVGARSVVGLLPAVVGLGCSSPVNASSVTCGPGTVQHDGQCVSTGDASGDDAGAAPDAREDASGDGDATLGADGTGQDSSGSSDAGGADAAATTDAAMDADVDADPCAASSPLLLDCTGQCSAATADASLCNGTLTTGTLLCPTVTPPTLPSGDFTIRTPTSSSMTSQCGGSCRYPSGGLVFYLAEGGVVEVPAPWWVFGYPQPYLPSSKGCSTGPASTTFTSVHCFVASSAQDVVVVSSTNVSDPSANITVHGSGTCGDM